MITLCYKSSILLDCARKEGSDVVLSPYIFLYSSSSSRFVARHVLSFLLFLDIHVIAVWCIK
jgi:hypothetical protein